MCATESFPKRLGSEPTATDTDMMRSNSEIRDRAWCLLWQGKWFWRLLGGAILLNVCTQVVYTVLNGILYRLGVFGMTAFTNALEEYAKNGAPLPEFTPDRIVQFASSTALTMFFVFIMGGIAAFGNGTLVIRAADENEDGWLKSAFGGFRMPLGLAWLSFRISLIYMGWCLVAFAPLVVVVGLATGSNASGISAGVGGAAAYALAVTAGLSLAAAILCVPIYRYRYLFRLKADHPDWSAGQCIRECSALSDGFKWRCFVHDCSYWKILLAPLLLSALFVAVVVAASTAKHWCAADVGAAVAAVGALVAIALYFALIALIAVAVWYIAVGQTLLYRDILQEKARQQ